MALEIRWQDISGLIRADNALKRLDSHAKHLVLQRAVNHTGDKARTQVIKALAKQTGLSQELIRKAVRVGRAWGAGADAETFTEGRGSLTYTLSTKGGDISLKYFKASVEKSGEQAYRTSANEPGKLVILKDDGKQLTGMSRSDWSADYPSIENFLNPLYRTGGSSNDSNYSNPEVDALLKKADETANEDEAIKIYQQAEDLIAKDLPSMPTWNEKGIGGRSKNLLEAKMSFKRQPVLESFRVKA